MVETAKANGIDPYNYLLYVLSVLPRSKCLSRCEVVKRLPRILRQGIDGLTAVIRRQLGVDPFQKNVLFMFCGRRPDKIKCLIWEGDGFLLLYKRLLDGKYQWPRTKQEVMEMTQEQFEWPMSGQCITPSIRKGKPTKML